MLRGREQLRTHLRVLGGGPTSLGRGRVLRDEPHTGRFKGTQFNLAFQHLIKTATDFLAPGGVDLILRVLCRATVQADQSRVHNCGAVMRRQRESARSTSTTSCAMRRVYDATLTPVRTAGSASPQCRIQAGAHIIDRQRHPRPRRGREVRRSRSLVSVAGRFGSRGGRRRGQRWGVAALRLDVDTLRRRVRTAPHLPDRESAKVSHPPSQSVRWGGAGCACLGSQQLANENPLEDLESLALNRYYRQRRRY